MRAYRDYIFIFNIYVPALLPCMLLCFPGAAVAAVALAVCLLCTSFLRGATLWSMTTVNQCRSILGDKVWMAHAPGFLVLGFCFVRPQMRSGLRCCN